MIIILHADTKRDDKGFGRLLEYLSTLENIQYRTYEEIGLRHTLIQVYLIGDTASLETRKIENFDVVERVVRVSKEYKVLGRHEGDNRPSDFECNGVRFGQDTLHVFAGLCAVCSADPHRAQNLQQPLQGRRVRMGNHCQIDGRLQHLAFSPFSLGSSLLITPLEDLFFQS